MKQSLRAAVIGLGHLHPRAYMPLFEACDRIQVVAACDANEQLLSPFCKDFGLKGYATLDAMLEEETLDMVAIFLPHDECEAAATRCAQHGLHLMVEKPIAQTSAAVQRIAAAVARKKVHITTGYCWRYHPVVAAMKEAIAEGKIGEIVSVDARLSAGRVERYIQGNSAWMLEKERSGGGPLYNLGVHWIDLLHFLLEDRVAEVCAVNSRTSDTYDIEDSSVAMLKFRKGPVGVLTTSYVVPDCFPNGRDLYIGIKGTRGVLSYAPGYEGEQGSSGAGQTDVLDIYSDAPVMAGARARHLGFQLDKITGYSGYMGKAYVDNFVDMIFNGATPMVTVEEAVDVLRVAEAIYASDEKQQWVKVAS